MRRRLLLIVNPSAAAGNGRARLHTLLGELDALGLAYEQALTEYPGHARVLARDARTDIDTVVAVGGDGTVNEVASGLIDSGRGDVAMGVIPTGTGNDVAMLSGIHTPLDGVHALLEGAPHPLDVIEVRCRLNGADITRHALLYAGAGFVSHVIRYTTPRVKRFFGKRLSYSVGFFRALLGYRAPMMQIRANDRELSGHIFFVGAGNAEFTGGGTMRLFPGARMDDGLLNAAIINELGRLEILRKFPHLLAGTQVEAIPQMQYFPTESLSIASDPPAEISIDGDICGQTPAEFRVLPGVLRMHGLLQIGRLLNEV